MSSPRTIVLYNADIWQHACPVIRITEPATVSGQRILCGAEYGDESVHILPELVAQSDLVVIQRDFAKHTYGYQTIIDCAHQYSKPVVYEVDDLLLELPTWHPDYHLYRPVRSTILQSIADADAVTVSTPALKHYLQQFTPNIFLLPNYLPDRVWRACLANTAQILDGETPLSQVQPNRLIIGYIGSHTHRPDVESIEPALLRILKRYQGVVTLKFWGTMPPPRLRDHPDVVWEDIRLVDYEQFANYFRTRRCDLFIAPLQDCAFNRCKSHLKYLEYSVMGIAGVYSRLEPYEQIVVHGQNGLLASGLDEWESQISYLLDHQEDRNRIARQAAETVRKEWLLSENTSQWMQAQEAIIAQGSHRSLNQYSRHISQQLVKWHEELEQKIAEKEGVIQSLRANQNQTVQALKESHAQSLQLKQQLGFIKAQLATIENSPGWRIVQMLTPIREWLVPRHSMRDQALQEGMYALGILRKEGLGSFSRRLIKRLRFGRSLSSVETSLEQTSLLSSGTPCPLPAISVVIIIGGSSVTVEKQQIIDWVAKQTLHEVDIIVWNTQVNLAFNIDGTSHSWSAPDYRSMAEGLNSRYLCIASTDLLNQPNTYLEENLITLETESLQLTVNLNGSATWVTSFIEQGLFPGNTEHPYLRQIIRQDVIGSTGTLNLSLDHGNIVGKIISHTLNHSDREGDFPCEISVSDEIANLDIIQNRIVRRSPKNTPYTHPVYTLQTVLPIQGLKSDLPTVILFMPFLAMGGAERIALDVIRGLRNEIRFVIVAPDPQDPSQGTMSDAFRQLTPYVYTSADFLSPALNLSFLEYLIKRFSPNCLYIANGSGWIYGSLGQVKQAFPSLRIVNQVYDHEAGWINLYNRSLCANLDGHIASNHKIQQAYIDRGANPEQVYYIENGIAAETWNPRNYSLAQVNTLKEKLGIDTEHKVVSFIARLHPQKRPMDFVELARRFTSIPEVTFLMVGDGILKDAVDAEIWRIGLRNIVRHGFYSPASDLYAISDIIVLPSEYEGMSMMVLESLCMGKPVVVTDVGNNRDMVDKTGGGVVVSNVGDVEALREAVKEMLNAPPDEQRVRQATLNHYDIEKEVALYKEALLGTSPNTIATHPLHG